MIIACCGIGMCRAYLVGRIPISEIPGEITSGNSRRHIGKLDGMVAGLVAVIVGLTSSKDATHRYRVAIGGAVTTQHGIAEGEANVIGAGCIIGMNRVGGTGSRTIAETPLIIEVVESGRHAAVVKGYRGTLHAVHEGGNRTLGGGPVAGQRKGCQGEQQRTKAAKGCDLFHWIVFFNVLTE